MIAIFGGAGLVAVVYLLVKSLNELDLPNASRVTLFANGIIAVFGFISAMILFFQSPLWGLLGLILTIISLTVYIIFKDSDAAAPDVDFTVNSPLLGSALTSVEEAKLKEKLLKDEASDKK